MKKILSVLAILFLAACSAQPLNASAGPQNGFDLHLDAKHFIKESRMPVHHWCKTLSSKFVECLLFDSDAQNANLIGVETIVTNDLWSAFTEEQQKQWHDHATEIIEAEATLPDTPPEEAAKIVSFLKGTHGRVVYFWNYPKDIYPTTKPFLDSERT